MEKDTNNQENVAKGKKVKKKRGKIISRIMGGDVLASKPVLKQIRLALLICFYAIVLVYNRYMVENLIKEKQATQIRIELLRERRIELQKHYQETIKISHIAELLDSTGIGITACPPYEI